MSPPGNGDDGRFSVIHNLFAGLAALLTLATGSAASAQNPTAEDFARMRARVNVVRPGLGDDPGYPVGVPLDLPAGVSLAGPIRGVVDPEDCGGQAGQGSGFSVMVCVPLCNTTVSTRTVELPAGLMVVAKSTGPYQNGLLIERVVVQVPPTPCGGGGIPLEKSPQRVAAEGPLEKGGHPVMLNLYCLNESAQPSEADIPYALGSVTRDPDLLDLLKRIGGRTLDEEGADTVQTAIYSITEGRGLSWTDEQDLARL